MPKPVRTWNQCGLSSRALEVLRKAEFDVPLAIQVRLPTADCSRYGPSTWTLSASSRAAQLL